MKKPRLKKFKVPKNVLKKGYEEEQPIDANVPKVTNETVAEHREKTLSKGRAYKFPLQYSKHKIVVISSVLFIAAVISFFVYTTLGLYKFKSDTSFLYGVTKVIPFPVARIGSGFVSYEDYLFELRHYVHYYQTQEKVDFNSALGKQQLNSYKQRALQKVINDFYIKQLAKQHNISISNKELNDEITLLRNQNRLGSNEKGFEDVLRDNFGWDLADFKRSLKQEMLAQKLIAALDTNTSARAQQAANLLASGAKFEDVAKKYSDDKFSKNNGGQYGYLIDKSNRDLSAQITQALFALKPGQTSSIINTGYTLEIVKNLGFQGGQVKAAHIVFSLQDINNYLNPQKDKEKAHLFIRL